MSINRNTDIFIVGAGPYAHELKAWMSSSISTVLIDHNEFDSVPLGSHVMLGFQNIEFRKQFLSTIKIDQFFWPSFIHKSAVITSDVPVKNGIVVGPQAVIGYGVSLGNFNNIGIMSKIGHGTCLDDNVVVSPGTIIGGSTSIGNNVFFGQACSIKDKITVCNNTYFAMNSVITKNIVVAGDYYGNRRKF